jgi:hypothetical protein
VFGKGERVNKNRHKGTPELLAEFYFFTGHLICGATYPKTIMNGKMDNKALRQVEVLLRTHS